MLLDQQVVIVTGSTTGIGAAIARACVEQGARVMLHGRDDTRAQQLVMELGTAHAAYFLADFEQPQPYELLVAETVARFGRVDALINNAGRSPRDTIDTVDEMRLEAVMRVNLKSALFLTQAVVQQFRRQNGVGSVVNIGSINAYCGQADLLAYAMTKGALMTMTRNLGNALGNERIRVNQLNVGWTLTDNESRIKEGEGFPEDWEARIPSTYAPSGRLLRPEDIARHAVFWASQASAPANGVVYELEQYPVVGRNLINELPLDIFN
ncbi:MAG: short-chain dehydrogenase [Gammaproteobacteria bacterium RIFCSPHIGHO2_12_FULL_45_9]|nr:MAG: short-chain dehydrogenase [Gammaproteobacteria bacterium RIFCSPHIGHO2_12_FULL_45_9]